MPAIKYQVNRTDDEKRTLQVVIRKGRTTARSQTRARILLKAAEVREPLPPEPGAPARYDTEYQRKGVCDLMMLCEPRRGFRAR
ncbi:MAG: hypothetical protein ACRERU_06845, partial [Methylococcales bacterium]